MKKIIFILMMFACYLTVDAQNRHVELFSASLDSAESLTGTTELGDYPVYYSVQLSVDTLTTYNDTAKAAIYVYESLDDTDYPTTPALSDTITILGATGTTILENLSATLVRKLKIVATGKRGSFANAKATIVWSRVEN